MARRLRVANLSESWKAKISTTKLAQRLTDHVDGRIELSSTQVRAAEILLRKLVPDLSSVSGPGEDGAHLFQIRHEME